jgi:RNA polymerase sigma factor (sigma-70 family)
MDAWSDDEICAGMAQPEQRERAFRALHLQYGPRLLGLLTRICRGDQDSAEDLLCRALYKAFLHLSCAASPPRSLRAWLYTVATRTAIDELRRPAQRDPIRNSVPLDEELLRVSQPPTSAEGDDGLDQAVADVLVRLEAEDPRYRTLLEMEHVGACDRGEIAEATGIERKQLSQYLKRARARFLALARQHPVLAKLEQGETPGDQP